MAVSAGTAYLDIVPRLQRNFSRDLTRQMFGPAGQAAERTGQKAGQQFGGAFAKGTRQGTRPAVGVFRQLRGEMSAALGGRAAAALGAGVVAAGLYQTVQAASDLNETISKTKVVFGPAARQVQDFGSQAAKSMGMSRQQALEAAATFGNLFVSMKIGRPAAAQMSTSMVKLAADLASFNNADPSEVLEALRSGLVGETEPLRRFGINLNDAALRAEAMRLGLGKVGPTLSAAQKAQASYSLILQQSKTAQGDFARTSDGLANQQRILNAEWKDAQAKLGTALLPVMVTAAGAANTLLDNFNKLDEATGGLASKSLLGGAALAALGVGVFKLVGYVKAARDAWIAYRGAALTTAAANALLTRQQILLGGATAAAGDAAAVAGGKFAIFSKLSVAALGAFTVAAAAGAYQGHQMANAFEEARGKTDLWSRILTFSIGGTKKQTEATKKQTDEQKTQNAATDAAKQAAQAYADALGAVAGGQQDTTAKTEELTGKLKGLKEEFANQSKAVEDSVKAYDGLIAKSDVTASQVIGDLHNQVRNFQTYSKDVQRLIKAGVDPKAIQELSTKGPQYVHALATGSNTQLKVFKGYWADRQREIRGSFADSMERQFKDLQDKIRKMNLEIAKLKGKTVTVAAGARITLEQQTKAALNALGIKGYGVKFLAQGGMVRLGETAIVGEQGPELVQFSRPARVIPNTESKQILERGMATGGIIGGFRDPAVQATTKYGKLAITKYAELFGRELGKVVNGTVLGGQSGPGGWRWQMAVLRNMFPGLPLISGFRPGAVTSTGNRSYHAMGRAVDVPPRWDVFNWISAVYGRNTKELIYTPAGSRQIKNGRHHVFTGGTIRQDHYKHIHWAYDKGGWLQPGQAGVNLTRKPERVLAPSERIPTAREIARELARVLQDNPPVVAVRDLQVGMNRYAGRFGQARPYR